MSDATSGTDLGKTSTGMQPNISALLAYALGLVTGVLFLVLEKDNRFVKFHAVQSIAFSVALALVSLVASFTPLLAPLALGLVQLAGFVVWIILMVKAFKGRWYRLPVVGDIAAKQAGLTP
jgi:uncharacterized membrane protein